MSSDYETWLRAQEPPDRQADERTIERTEAQVLERYQEEISNYDPGDDFDASINACYAAIRARVRAGGTGWKPR